MKVLKKDTEQWGMFEKMPFPLTFKVYLFDVQNPDEILQGATPVIKEKGPYSYKLYKFNSDITISNEQISFFMNRRFYFDKETSGDVSENDDVTILNTVYLNVLYKIEETQPGVMPMVTTALPSIFGELDGVFAKVKVKDYLFEGLKICENAGAAGGFVASMACKQIMAKVSLSPTMRVQDNSVYFANLRHKNTTHTGRFTINSGIVEREKAGILEMYNEKQYISAWDEAKSLCNKIRGLTTVFPVGVKPEMVFESFSEDICRTMALVYSNEETVKDIPGLKFVAANTSFDYGQTENTCYCLNQTRTPKGQSGCPKKGLMDLTTCAGGPIFLSFPHLLYADEEYFKSVHGLKPNVSEHETFVTLEPASGFPLKLAQRVQFNMFLRPIEGFEPTANITESLVPLFWVEESTILGDKFIDMLKTKLIRTLQIVHVAKWAVVAIGTSCVLLALFLLVYIQDL